MKQGDIVLLPFPFSDLSSSKVRPAVVISNNTYDGEDIIVCGVTSQNIHKQSIEIFNENLDQGTLPVISYIRPLKVVSLHKKIVRKIVARLNKDTLQKVILLLQEYILIDNINE